MWSTYHGKILLLVRYFNGNFEKKTLIYYKHFEILTFI